MTTNPMIHRLFCVAALGGLFACTDQSGVVMPKAEIRNDPSASANSTAQIEALIDERLTTAIEAHKAWIEASTLSRSEVEGIVDQRLQTLLERSKQGATREDPATSRSADQGPVLDIRGSARESKGYIWSAFDWKAGWIQATKSGRQYLAVELTMVHGGDEAAELPDFWLVRQATKGPRYEPSRDLRHLDGAFSSYERINRGVKRLGRLFFEVPVTEKYSLQFRDPVSGLLHELAFRWK